MKNAAAPSWGRGTRAGRTNGERTVYPGLGRYRLEGVDRPGLLASGGVGVGLTVDRQEEEPSQQRKAEQAQTPWPGSLGPRLGCEWSGEVTAWTWPKRTRDGPSKGCPLQEVKRRHPPCFHFLLLPKYVACELLFLFF